MAEDRKVYVVDDDASVLESLTVLLSTLGFKATGFGSAAAFLNEYRPNGNACLLLDIMMPGMDGLAMQQELAARKINIPVIFITGHGNVKISVNAMKAGAFDFLEKPFRDDVLIASIEGALAQQEEKLRKFADIQCKIEAVETLTPREKDVFTLLADGAANKVVARKLGISVRTTEVHRAHIMRKLEADSLSQLVRIAMAQEK